MLLLWIIYTNYTNECIGGIRRDRRDREGYSMNTETIIQKIGEGMALKVPKQHLREIGRVPLLIDGHRRDSEFKKQPILVGWEEVDMILLDNKLYQKHRVNLAKAEKDDIVHKDGDGNITSKKEGWKSKGWDGKNFDYYRLIQ